MRGDERAHLSDGLPGELSGDQLQVGEARLGRHKRFVGVETELLNLSFVVEDLESESAHALGLQFGGALESNGSCHAHNARDDAAVLASGRQERLNEVETRAEAAVAERADNDNSLHLFAEHRVGLFEQALVKALDRGVCQKSVPSLAFAWDGHCVARVDELANDEDECFVGLLLLGALDAQGDGL